MTDMIPLDVKSLDVKTLEMYLSVKIIDIERRCACFARSALKRGEFERWRFVPG
jgi:hypothetical protein